MAGLQYLHNLGMVHGYNLNSKFSNVQLDSIVFSNKSMENIKLIDFGISN